MKIKNVIFLLLLTSMLHAQGLKNVIFICLEGTSRETLYALTNKERLPAFKKIVSKGNYRNLEVKENALQNKLVYFNLFSGSIPKENQLFIQKNKSVFDTIKLNQPIRKTIMIPSLANENQQPVRTFVLGEASKSNIDHLYEEKFRTVAQIKEQVITSLSDLDAPFFLFVNFPNVDNIGTHYREGASLYSEALIKADQQLLEIVLFLEETQLWENTDLLLTTQHGFMKNSQIPSPLIWVAGTFKAQFKGDQSDIVPTLYDLMGLPKQTLQGQSLKHPKLRHNNKSTQAIEK